MSLTWFFLSCFYIFPEMYFTNKVKTEYVQDWPLLSERVNLQWSSTQENIIYLANYSKFKFYCKFGIFLTSKTFLWTSQTYQKKPQTNQHGWVA